MPLKSFKPSLPREEQKQRSRDRMINLLFRGIIDANPHHDPNVTAETRLARAREALLGEKPGRGRKAIQDGVELFPAIQEAFKYEIDKMKRLFLKRQKPEIQEKMERELAEPQKSMRAIAKSYVPEFEKSMTTPESTEDWLRKKLAGLPLTLHDMADLEGLFYGDLPKANRLQHIFDELRALGINNTNPIGAERNGITPKQD